MIVQTPGVYITEKNNIPASIAGISTAVPAFIGFTELAVTNPVRISSLLDFEAQFGIGYETTFNVAVDAAHEVTALTTGRRFFLYDSLHLYFRNGGGPCHILSAGTYANFESKTSSNIQLALSAQLTKIDPLDEVTILLIPDAHTQKAGASLSPADYTSLVNESLNKCLELQDKFALFDYLNMDQNATDIRGYISPIAGAQKYGSMYYPWLKNGYVPVLNIDSILGYTPASSNEIRNIDNDISGLNNEFPEGITLKEMKDEYYTLVSDYYTGNNKVKFTAIFEYLFNIVKRLENIENTSVSSIELTNLLSNLKTNSNFIHEVQVLYRFTNILAGFNAGNGSVTFANSISNYPTDVNWFNYNNLTISGASIANDAAILPDSIVDLFTPSTDNKTRPEILAEFNAGNYVNMDIILGSINSLVSALKKRKTEFAAQLFSNDPAYINIKTAIDNYTKQIPAQGAIAGIYCKNDRNRGVWKSPANIAVQGIEKPMVEVSNAEQDLLNVDVANGKSINVIRTFTGKGPLVWGARTLDGESNEWRYIAVRRFFNFAEESIKKALNDFVYEPNNARTWVKIKAMVTSFLVNQWRSGALVGTEMKEAFFVNIGVDITTTPAEILQGIIKIEIGMAVARPAEFIIVEFSHQTK